jgi:16S rRNA (guanine966-N2)-methyltransferase
MAAISGAPVLDRFAGTGALGIEALSRGATTAIFVDADPRSVATIKANLRATGMGERARVVQADVVRFLSESPPTEVDVAFADPPYAFDGWARLLEVLPARMIAIEARAHIDLAPPWHPIRSKRYGDTVVTLARFEQDPERQNTVPEEG